MTQQQQQQPRTAAEDRRMRAAAKRAADAEAKAEQQRADMRALMNGGRYAGPAKETKVQQEAGPATVAARTRRARKAATRTVTAVPLTDAEAANLAGLPELAGLVVVDVPELVAVPADMPASDVDAAVERLRAERRAAAVQPAPKAVRAPKPAAEDAPAGMRRCAGAPKWGAPAHFVVEASWDAPASSRSCGVCRAHYAAAVKAARGTTAPQGRSGATELPPLVVVDGTEAQKAEIAALEVAVNAVGVESDEGQAMLAAAAAEAAAARRAVAAEAKRRQRAAAKARKAQVN